METLTKLTQIKSNQISVFEERGKAEHPEKYRIWESDTGQIGGRRVLSPLRYPSSSLYDFELEFEYEFSPKRLWDKIALLLFKQNKLRDYFHYLGVQYYTGQFFDIEKITAAAQKKVCLKTLRVSFMCQFYFEGKEIANVNIRK